MGRGDPPGGLRESSASWPPDAPIWVAPRVHPPPRPRLLRPILDYARTTRVNIIVLTDQMSVLWARKFASAVLPCHVASHGLGPSYTAMASAVQLLAMALAERLGRKAGPAVTHEIRRGNRVTVVEILPLI